MDSKRKKRFLIMWVSLLVLLLILIFLMPSAHKTETIQEAMKDAVLHEDNKVAFLGMEVNPSIASDWVIVGVLLIFALAVRIFAIPRFKEVPGKFQLLLETLVGFFTDLAKGNSPHRNQFLGGYLLFAGVYIFFGTTFELFGIQWITTQGYSISLPAPLSDINAAIALGFLSYGIIMSGGIASNGIKGIGLTLKDFSLPISMSFRLFGALLSGLLVTELVYFTMGLSFVLPVVVGILFTLLHAIIQTYVLTMLTSVFYGEVSEKTTKKEKEVTAS
ncbi:MAG: F0F1 ATP synthase subunit A [Firmicutes bacterium]|nr:F0F1 ATP synthase subunit A [Bacillota bacterium]